MTNPTTFHVDFPFRGQRAYVHSASMANYFATHFPQAEQFEIVIKEWMDSRVVFSPVAALDNSGNGYVKMVIAGEAKLFSFAQDKAHPVQARDEYDEAALVANAGVLDKTLTCLPAGQGRFFDRLIAANKVLINQVCQPNVKLVASKISTQGFLEDAASFQLVLTAHVGTRIFKTQILVDQKPYGEVIFYGQ